MKIMTSVWIQELTSDDVEEFLKRDSTVIVPIGSTETHGPHLPLGTDSYQAIDFSEEIAKRAGCLCAPPIWFGDSSHHLGKAGTISLRQDTVIAVLKDVYRSLIRHGFTKIITFNGHRRANNPVIQIAASQVKDDHPDVLFALYDPILIAAEAHKRLRSAQGEGIHGGETEASHMLFRHPELVHTEKFERAHGILIESPYTPADYFASGDKVIWIRSWKDQLKMAPRGHHGDPTRASEEKGKELLEAVVANGVEFIEYMRKFTGAREDY